MENSSPNYEATIFQLKRQLEEEQQRREELEARTRKTNLLELLDACHVDLHLNLKVETNLSICTKGNLANADSKLRPDYIRPWKEFDIEQQAIWKDLMESDFVKQRHFSSTNTLRETGERAGQRFLSSEQDLCILQRNSVEDYVVDIIAQLYKDPTLRERFKLESSVKFENHGNTIIAETRLQQAMEKMKIANAPEEPQRLNPSQASTTERSTLATRADQFCIYKISTGFPTGDENIPIFIIEYKAAHKLTLELVEEGLKNIEDVNVELLARTYEKDEKKRSQSLIAAVITQAFHYMIQSALTYGCICAGEAYIFLRIPNNARIVHYFLSVPKRDVGQETGYNPILAHDNRLRLTAVGQMLTFTLLATRKAPRPRKWVKRAIAKLEKWEIVPEEIVDEMPSSTLDSSEYRPSTSKMNLFRESPVQTRSKKQSGREQPSKKQSSKKQSSRGKCKVTETPRSSDEDESGPKSSLYRQQQSSAARSTAKSKDTTVNSDWDGTTEFHFKEYRYCTPECLRGLIDGGSLDKKCPNVNIHGSQRHKINQPTFLRLISEQIARDPDYNIDCLRIHGARGAMFCIRLTVYGYTVAAKGTTRELTRYLLHEAGIYKSLRSIQGEHVPVHLGNIDLVDPYFYDGYTILSHMMFMSYGGSPLYKHVNSENRTLIKQKVAQAIAAVHSLSILHNDAMPRNLLWNIQTQSVVIIDFERSQRCTHPAILSETPGNRQRRLENDDKSTQINDTSSLLSREAREALRAIDSIS